MSLIPSVFQHEAFKWAVEQNVIVRMDTGSGKTLISIMLIRHLTSQADQHLTSSKIFFLAPLRALVHQQAEAIRAQSALKVREISGDKSVDAWNKTQWESEINDAHVLVLTPALMLHILDCSFWPLKKISLLVFDEAHHCMKAHPYNNIMSKHYHPARTNNYQTPKILGLTASPIHQENNAATRIATLEANLNSKLIEIDTSVLYATRKKVVERLITHPPLSEELRSQAKYLKLNLSLVSYFLKPRFLVNLELMERLFGPYAADLHILTTLKSLISSKGKPVRETIHSKSSQEVEPEIYSVKDLQSLLTSFLPNFSPTALIDTSFLSPKLKALVQVLQEHYSESPKSFKCILFVEMRSQAEILASILTKVEGISEWASVGYLVGHGTEKLDGGMSTSDQMDVIKKMRTGQVNILVASQIAEEGLDFPECNLVCRLDTIENLRSYTQSKGRARAFNSVFVVFAEEGSRGVEKYLQYSAAEEQVQNEIKAREGQEVEEPELDDLPIFQVEATGALLSYSTAVQRLNEICSLLPVDPFTSLTSPKYEIFLAEDTPSLFTCAVQIPMISYLPEECEFVGDAYPTKRAAKQSAAFKVCVKLYHAGGLDDNLIPISEKRIGTNVDADGKAVSKELFSRFRSVEFPHAFSHPIEAGKLVFLSVVSLKCMDEEIKMGLITSIEVPIITDTTFYEDNLEDSDKCKTWALSLANSTALPTNYLNITRYEQLRKLNYTSLRLYHHRNISPTAPSFLLWAPLTPTLEVDWQEVTREHFSPVSLESLISEEEIWVLPSRIKRCKLNYLDIRADVNSLSLPIEVDQTPGASRRKLMKACDSFSSYTALAYDYRTDLEKPEPIIRLYETMPEQSLAQMEKPEAGKWGHRRVSRVLKERNYPLGLLRRNALSQEWIQFTLLIPAVFRVIHDYCRTSNTVEIFGLQTLRKDLFIPALTIPGTMTGQDYQTLETVGDSILKLLTTIHAFLTHPFAHEGILSALRGNSVGNAFLRQKCWDSGLATAALAERYLHRPEAWHPPWMMSSLTQMVKKEDGTYVIKRQMHRKAMSDIVESSLGAAYLTGGFELALALGEKLDLCFGGVLHWSKRPEGKLVLDNLQQTETPPNFHQVQNNLRYQFKDSRLLLRAFTHRSYGINGYQCYERLEFLGDALLDVWATQTIYWRYPNTTSRKLSFTRAVLVSNVTAGFLSLKVLEAQKNILRYSPALDTAITETLKIIESPEYTWSKVLRDMTWFLEIPKVLGDVFEAVLGAIFVDSGFDVQTVFNVLDHVYKDILPLIEDTETRDPCSHLYISIHARGCRMIRIKTEYVESTMPMYKATLLCHDEDMLECTARTRPVARQLLAYRALEEKVLPADSICEICLRNRAEPVNEATEPSRSMKRKISSANDDESSEAENEEEEQDTTGKILDEKEREEEILVGINADEHTSSAQFLEILQ